MTINDTLVNTLTLSRLRSLLDYEAHTGQLIWRESRGKARIGDQAGCLNSKGYRVLLIDGIQHKAHRLAWFHYYGYWPTLNLDHVNGDRDDNRIKNLREATVLENNQNKLFAGGPGRRTKGYSFYKGKYRASITLKGRKHYIGGFDTEEAARAAYLRAFEERMQKNSEMRKKSLVKTKVAC